MAMAVRYYLLVALLAMHQFSFESEAVLFSSLTQVLDVSTQFINDPTIDKLPVLIADEGEITITWGYKQPVPGAEYKTKLQLCYAPVSQLNRGWRKSNNDLTKDKTCQFDITTSNATSGVYTWKVTKIIPTATYFVRAYALDNTQEKIGFGQSTDKNKTINLFEVEGISGRTATLDIAAGVFSAFSVFALVGFFIFENTLLKKTK